MTGFQFCAIITVTITFCCQDLSSFFPLAFVKYASTDALTVQQIYFKRQANPTHLVG
jgi:hypothetical protein